MKEATPKNAFALYGYKEINNQIYYGKYAYDASAKKYVFVRYGRYIGIEKTSQDLDGGEQIITIAFDDLHGSNLQIDIERSFLGRKKELQSLLLGKGADVADQSLGVLLGCLRNSEETAETAYCFHRTGWLTQGSSANDDLCFKSNSLIEKDKQLDEIRYIGVYDLYKAGSFDQWKAMVVEKVLGTIPLEIAVLIGLSPIISSKWGARNLIFHLMGDSGKGKTTSAILAVSTTGCPNSTETGTRKNAKGKPLRSLMSSWRGTANALTAKLDGLDGTLLVFDELSKLEDSKLLAPIVYTISDGADKDRMESPTSRQATNMFRTNILSLGEESLLKKVTAKNTGINVRVCEISGEFTTSPEQSEVITQVCFENYGHAAPLFAKHIVDTLSYEAVAQIREKNLCEYTESLKEAGCKSETLRRLAEFGAILLTVADIAEPALGIHFSKASIKDFLAKQQSETDNNQDIGLRAHTALRDFVTTNNTYFSEGNNLEWGKNIPCYGRIDRAKDGKPMEVSFVKSEFSNIMVKLGFNNADLIIDRLKDQGLLNHEAGKRYRKRTITKATGPVPVYTIIFPDR